MFARSFSSQLMKSVLRRPFSTGPLKTSTYKTTTGLVGLAVDTDARNTLMNLTETCLKSVQRAPEDSAYRMKVEEWMNFIIKSVKMTEDVKAIEDYIDLGQIEEVIQMVKDEIELSEEYIENKGWELCDESDLRATEWYDINTEDLHYQGMTDGVEEQNKQAH